MFCNDYYRGFVEIITPKIDINIKYWCKGSHIGFGNYRKDSNIDVKLSHRYRLIS
uniref:Uncharacterized protein n=1 Tax=viral metagenome TaxID=1070528 RepID=A0A6C0JRL3_9ZZZZ